MEHLINDEIDETEYHIQEGHAQQIIRADMGIQPQKHHQAKKQHGNCAEHPPAAFPHMLRQKLIGLPQIPHKQKEDYRKESAPYQSIQLNQAVLHVRRPAQQETGQYSGKINGIDCRKKAE